WHRNFSEIISIRVKESEQELKKEEILVSKRNSVLGISLSLSILFVIIGVVFNEWLGEKASSFLDFAVTYFNWMYLLVGSIFVGVCLFLMFSKYGNIRLGKDTDR